MPTLTTLPVELQEHIIQFLGPKATLCLAKTCNTLAATSLPHLYHTIRLTWNATNSQPRQPRIASLLCSVATHPNLAAAVKVLKLDATRFTARKENRLSYPKKVFRITDEEFKATGHALRAVKMPDRRKWEHAIKDQDLDAFLALLISQCANLENLSMGAYFLNSNEFLPAMLRHMVQKSGFSKLEHVSLGVDMQEYRDDSTFLKIDADTVLPILHVPNLRSAALLLNKPSSVSDLPERMPELTELRLQRSRVPGPMLSPLLSSIPKLTSFEYDYWPKIGGEKTDCQAIVDALKPFQSTLKHLRICVQPFSNNTLVTFEFSVDEFVNGCIGSSLKDFSALENLEVSLVVLLGNRVATAAPLAAVLPPDLQVLTIRDDLWDYEDWEWGEMAYIKLFYDFLKHGKWRETCPNLRYINLRLDETMDDDWDAEKREKFKKMCNVKGVDCGIYKLRVDRDEGVNGTWKEEGKRGEIFEAYFQ